MLRRDLLRRLVMTPLAGWFRPWLPTAFGAAAVENPNAAVAYRKAFAWAESLRPEDSERLRNFATVAIDDRHVDDVIENAGALLKAIQEAAMLDQCHWETEILTSDDLGKGRVNISNMNILSVACLSARRHARMGRGQAALDDVFAGLALAHRIGIDGVLFARMMESAGEARLFQTLGRILPALDRITLDDLSRRLDALHPPELASAMIGPESRFILGHLRAKLTVVEPVLKDSDWAESGFGEEETATLKRLTGGHRAELLTHLEATGPTFAELARLLDLPRPGCREAIDEFAKAKRLTQPIVANFADKAWNARQMVDRMQAFRALLHAGITLIRQGKPAFFAIPDPYGTGPFSLKHQGESHVIRSALSDESKPDVSLIIGEP